MISKIDLLVLTRIWGNTLCLAAQEDHSGPYKHPAKIAKKLEEPAVFVWHKMYEHYLN